MLFTRMPRTPSRSTTAPVSVTAWPASPAIVRCFSSLFLRKLNSAECESRLPSGPAQLVGGEFLVSFKYVR